MNPVSWQQAWIWYATAVALGAVGFGLLVWFWRGDRARGRRRCPKCWYDLSAAVGSGEVGETFMCPECGRVVHGERGLLRTRRRRRWVLIAVVALVGAWVVGQQPTVKQRGWMWLVPMWALKQALPIWPERDGAINQELCRRMGIRAWPNVSIELTLCDSQLAALMETCAEGTWLARPMSERWRRSFGELTRTGLLTPYYRRVVEQQQQRPISPRDAKRIHAASDALRRLHGPLGVRTREKWPVGVPVLLSVPVETWWRGERMERMMLIRWTDERTGEKSEAWCTGHGTIKPLGEVSDHVRLRVELEWVEGKPGMHKTREYAVLSRAESLIEYDVVASIDDILKPVSSAALDGSLAAAMTYPRGFQLDWQSLNAFATAQPADLSFGVRYEISLDGEVIATMPLRFYGGLPLRATQSGPSPVGRSWAEVQPLLQHPNLKARLVTDDAWALYNIDATNYWKGEVDVGVTPAK